MSHDDATAGPMALVANMPPMCVAHAEVLTRANTLDRQSPTVNTTGKLTSAPGCVGVFYFTPHVVIIEPVLSHHFRE